MHYLQLVREASRRRAEAPDSSAAKPERGICQGEELGRALFQSAPARPQSGGPLQPRKRERRSGSGDPETS
jgi:hypothetical protein